MSGFGVDHMANGRHFGYIMQDGERIEYNHPMDECDYDNNCGVISAVGSQTEEP